jgi:hypothetical protein
LTDAVDHGEAQRLLGAVVIDPLHLGQPWLEPHRGRPIYLGHPAQPFNQDLAVPCGDLKPAD